MHGAEAQQLLWCRVWLHFGGVNNAFYCWLNGTLLGYSQDSCCPAEFDVTAVLKPGQNLLAVQVCNHRPADSSSGSCQLPSVNTPQPVSECLQAAIGCGFVTRESSGVPWPANGVQAPALHEGQIRHGSVSDPEARRLQRPGMSWLLVMFIMLMFSRLACS